MILWFSETNWFAGFNSLPSVFFHLTHSVYFTLFLVLFLSANPSLGQFAFDDNCRSCTIKLICQFVELLKTTLKKIVFFFFLEVYQSTPEGCDKELKSEFEDWFNDYYQAFCTAWIKPRLLISMSTIAIIKWRTQEYPTKKETKQDVQSSYKNGNMIPTYKKKCERTKIDE